MKQILLPTDFSENAYNAMSYALQLYKDVKCKFYILHTYTPTVTSRGSNVDTSSPLVLKDVVKEIAERKLKKIQDELNKKFNNVNHTFITALSYNLLIPEMKSVIKEKDIDLIIMGSKGTTSAKETFIGKNTMYAIKKLQSPVIAIPSRFKYEKPRGVVLPADYKFSKSNKCLLLIKELCEAHDFRSHILNDYNHTLEEKQKQLANFLDVFFKDNPHLSKTGERLDLIDTIDAFEAKQKVNFLIMIHNKHNFFENLLFKPVVNQIVYDTNVPFMVIPSEAS